MAYRKLTETFMFMRNNAIQNRQFSGETHVRSPDRVKLLNDMTNIELGPSKSSAGIQEWQNIVKSIHFEFSVVRQKMKDLVSLHDHHVMASTLDDSGEEDQEVEMQTKELTQLISLCHRQLGQLIALKRRIQSNGEMQSDKFMNNVISSIARTLQELSLTFRKVQSQYLNRLKARDERIRGYLNMTMNTELTADDVAGLEDFEFEPSNNGDERAQILLSENTKAVERREHEITQIVRSIHELNEIFRDVAQLVVDQGTLVDRIDYNVEQTQMRVSQGLVQLTKAESHQKRDKKLFVIFILACLVMVLGTLLIFTKFL